MKMRFVVMREGIFNLADSIKYIVSSTSKVGGVNITHSESENLHLEVQQLKPLSLIHI